MDLNSIPPFVQVLLYIIGFTVLPFYIKSVLGASIKLEFDERLEEHKKELQKELEEFKEELKRRERSTIVADLILEWADFPSEHNELNRLALQAAIWLPADIYESLAPVLTGEDKSENNVRKILTKVRGHINPQDPIDDWKIVYFPNRSNTS